MSSANNLIAQLDEPNIDVISLKNIKNKIGPRTLPWGTPLATLEVKFESESPIFTCCVLLLKNEEIQ